MKHLVKVIDFIKGFSIFIVVHFHHFQGIHFSPLLSKANHFGGT